ncbi:MAG TPA: hypothetical protein VHS96_06875, partial [Bacteroidia bacterium]|nr:hypothetical protein [Bacteroidia bacterium]
RIVYSANVPAGDLYDRFGFSNQIGGEGGLKLANNFYASTGLKFFFGGQVREAVAGNVVQLIGSDSTGYQTMALGADGRYYTVRYFLRGWVIPFTVGKIFPLGKKNLNSGIYVEVGGQFIQHKIAIQAIGDNVPYLSKPYLKGYDRLTNGLGLVEGFGYRHFGNNRFTNFFIGAELSQNFTKSRRDINFDTGVKDDARRLDLLLGLKAGWTFPIYKSAPEKEYYY